jgi:hypothetical protein
MPRKQGHWDPQVQEERRKLAERLLAAGVPVGAVAKQVQMSPNWVGRLKRELPESKHDPGSAA